MIKGSKHSKETCRKMSLAKIGKPSNNLGKKMSIEQKEKLRQANLGKKHSKKTILKLRKIALEMFRKRPEVRQMIADAQRGEKHHNWKNGKSKKMNGYILLLKPKHPFANSNRYIMEHRYVMEQKIGRYLKPEEVVHHINGDISDNRIENLELLPSKSAHRKLHGETHSYLP